MLFGIAITSNSYTYTQFSHLVVVNFPHRQKNIGKLFGVVFSISFLPTALHIMQTELINQIFVFQLILLCVVNLQMDFFYFTFFYACSSSETVFNGPQKNK